MAAIEHATIHISTAELAKLRKVVPEAAAVFPLRSFAAIEALLGIGLPYPAIKLRLGLDLRIVIDPEL